MGVVYRAYDTRLDREVAIKQMVAELGDDPQLRQRFTQEARAAARLNHRNIITIYELHESDTDLFIVMELLEGVDLATLMKRQTPLPLEAKLNMMAQVCDGLDYAHQKGIVHRDIKPANLHVSPAGVVTILDFGIARLAASKMTSTGGLIGTPDYMSPEQVMAGNLDARSDLFAVGAVTYELLSGFKPFEADAVTALLMKIARDPHVPLRQRAPRLPAAAIDLVERLLAKNPNDRPATAREVQEALLRITPDRPPLDAETVSVLRSAVSEETLKPRTPPPPTRPTPSTAAPAAAAPSPPTSDSALRLASLAIERGRSLREAGDLAGAMKVFRSVLEIAPGNQEALRELEEMERAVARLTASGRGAAPVEPPTGLASEQTVRRPPAPPPPPEVPAAGAPPPPRPSGARSGGVGAVVNLVPLAIGVIVVIALAAGGWFLWSSRRSEPPADPAVVSSSVPATTTSAGPIALAPATTTIPVVETVPTATVSLPPVSSVPPSSIAPGDRRTAAGTTTTTAPAARDRGTQPEPAVALSNSAPASSPPSPVSAPAVVPPPPPAAPPVTAYAVRHFHARAFFRGGGACEGTLEILPDGVHFKTTTPSPDGRQEDQKILFKDIEAHEIDEGRLHIETNEKNWDFGGALDALERIEQVLKANVKS